MAGTRTARAKNKPGKAGDGESTGWRNRIVGHDEVDPNTLIPHPLNFRTHPESQHAALVGSIKDVGFIRSVTVNKRTGRVLDGHLRLEEALLSKQATIAVEYVDLDEAEERQALATIDPLAAMAVADAVKLEALLREVQTGDPALQQMLADLAEENGVIPPLPEPAVDAGPQMDRAAELQAKWGTASGQLWEIPSVSVPGKCHRLLCGDSTKAEDVERVMGGERAGLRFMSLPYDQQRKYESGIGDWLTLMKGVFANLPMADDGQVLVNLGLIHREGEWVPHWDPWIEWMREQGWRRFGWYVWDQGHGLPGDWNGRLAPSFEFVFHFNKEAVQVSKWVDKLPDSIELNTHGTGIRTRTGEMSGVSSPEASLQPTKIPDNVLRIMRHKARNVPGHPAMFPVPFPEFGMKCWPGIAYEPFAGSGTTLVAGEQLGRLVRGIEIEPKYIAVILERLRALGLSPRQL